MAKPQNEALPRFCAVTLRFGMGSLQCLFNEQARQGDDAHTGTGGATLILQPFAA